jgi:hypothetical protein
MQQFLWEHLTRHTLCWSFSYCFHQQIWIYSSEFLWLKYAQKGKRLQYVPHIIQMQPRNWNKFQNSSSGDAEQLEILCSVTRWQLWSRHIWLTILYVSSVTFTVSSITLSAPTGLGPAMSTVPGQVYRGNAQGIQSHQNPDDGDRDDSRNVSFFLQPTDTAVCLRRFYRILSEFINLLVPNDTVQH